MAAAHFTLVRMAGFVAGLCGQAYIGVREAITAIATPFCNLEKEALVEGAGEELKVVAVLIAIEEDVPTAKLGRQFFRQAESDLDIIKVVRRDRQDVEIQGRCRLSRAENVAAFERDMLNTGALAAFDEARSEAVARRRAVQEYSETRVRRLDSLRLNQSKGVRDFDGGRLRQLEQARVMQLPGQKLCDAHGLREVVHARECRHSRVRDVCCRQ